MNVLFAYTALYLSVILLQLSSGGVGPLDALSGIALGFTTTEIGLLGSAHYLGFLGGCWWAPRLMGAVGASRAFTVFSSLGAIGLIAHMMLVDPWAWALMRMASGLCIAGSYTVIEAWMQASATNANRGRTMASYRLVDLGASLAAQLMIGVLEPAAYVSYNILGLFCCAAILPLAMSRSKPPPSRQHPRLRPRLPLACSPLAVMAVLVAATSAASFRMIGPIYGAEIGLDPDQIALFLAIFILGGALVQYPVGFLADRFDRRWVLLGLSAASIATCLLTAMMPVGNIALIYLMSALYGIAWVPIYSVAAAHAHDFAKGDERVELSAGLLFYFALGAITAPYLSSLLIARIGPLGMFWLIAAAHIVLISFGLLRMTVRPTAQRRTRYVYAPRTSFLLGRMMRFLRDPPPRHNGKPPTKNV